MCSYVVNQLLPSPPAHNMHLVMGVVVVEAVHTNIVFDGDHYFIYDNSNGLGSSKGLGRGIGRGSSTGFSGGNSSSNGLSRGSSRG